MNCKKTCLFAASFVAIFLFVALALFQSQLNPCPVLHPPILNYTEFVRAEPPSAMSKSSQWALFILYTWNLDVTRQTLASLQDLRPNIIFVDNTRRLEPSRVSDLADEIYVPDARMSFSQLQNTMGNVAIARNYKFFVWVHSDVYVLSKNETLNVREAIFNGIARISAYVISVRAVVLTISSHPNWGVIFLGTYDWIAVFNVEVSKRMKWDQAISHYTSDCDYYYRMRALGFASVDCDCLYTFDTDRVFDIPKSYSQALPYLRNLGSEHGKYRESTLTEQERFARSLQDRIDREYFSRKWGSGDCNIRQGTKPRFADPDSLVG